MIDWEKLKKDNEKAMDKLINDLNEGIKYGDKQNASDQTLRKYCLEAAISAGASQMQAIPLAEQYFSYLKHGIPEKPKTDDVVDSQKNNATQQKHHTHFFWY